MGIIIKNKQADYSANAIGNVDQLKDYFIKAKITSQTIKPAVTNLISGAKDANIFNKLTGIALFHGGTSLEQRWILTPDGVDTLSFIGQPTFSATLGFKPDVASYAIAPYTPPAGNISNLSLGAYTTSARNYSAIMGVTSITDEAPSDFLVNIMPATTTGRVQAAICKKSTPGLVFTDANHPSASSARGFLQFTRNANVLTLSDNGGTIATGSISTLPVGGGTQKLKIGAGYDTNDLTTLKYCNTQIAMACWGRLTESEAVIWNTLVQSYMTAISR